MFSFILENFLPIFIKFELSSANSLNHEESKICRLGLANDTMVIYVMLKLKKSLWITFIIIISIIITISIIYIMGWRPKIYEINLLMFIIIII